MKAIGSMAAFAALLLPAAEARAESSPLQAQVGDTYEITLQRETKQEGSDGSSGSSHDRDTIVERVIGVRPDGVELEYHVPQSDPAEAGGANWQFPARIFKPNGGPMQLVNRAELEARVEAWLKRAKMTRAACGRWIFTWNAFRIECDPQSAIGIVQAYDPGLPALREGAPYRASEARSPAPLTRSGSTFVATMEVDAEAVRRGRAESDVAVGELMGDPVTFEVAAGKRAKEAVSGTVSVTFETDPAGRIWRRTKVTKLEIKEPDGRVEKAIATEILERRRVAGRAPGG